jgi:hypothetical protein
MQRGLVITFAASANKARERAARSLMLANELGGRKLSGVSATGCAHARQLTSVAIHVAVPKLISVDETHMKYLFAITATPCRLTLTYERQRSMVSVGSAALLEIICDRRWIGRQRHRAPRDSPQPRCRTALSRARPREGDVLASASGVGRLRMIESVVTGGSRRARCELGRRRRLSIYGRRNKDYCCHHSNGARSLICPLLR